MKKNIYLLILLTVFILAGCKKQDQMTNFIPTPIPGEVGSEEITPTGAASKTEATPKPKTVYVGQTTTKYVKLDEYDDTLNIRPNPSTDQEAVGFLVHTEKIEVIEIKDGWASFVYNNAVCYVNADYLVDEKPDYLDPPTPTPVQKNIATPVPKNTATPVPATDGPQI
ncbi:MAG: SH3 domain-containing protein [Herbinix sp.]|nr:SH3 domain-containing protein [Herbinix sp.]